MGNRAYGAKRSREKGIGIDERNAHVHQGAEHGLQPAPGGTSLSGLRRRQARGGGLDRQAPSRRVGAQPFDARTDTLLYPDPPSGPHELTAESYFGGECDPYLNCLDIDDFHGKTIVIQRGTSYSVTVDVKYVNELDPTILAGTQTFAKLVTLTIENTYIRDPVEDRPLAMNISRVYTYLRTTI